MMNINPMKELEQLPDSPQLIPCEVRSHIGWLPAFVDCRMFHERDNMYSAIFPEVRDMHPQYIVYTEIEGKSIVIALDEELVRFQSKDDKARAYRQPVVTTDFSWLET